MTSSLVGSEMCIRDSLFAARPKGNEHKRCLIDGALGNPTKLRPSTSLRTVSYTHLTLPTICSV
eukprot:8681923-Prorocentrum_lima.AAC.1